MGMSVALGELNSRQKEVGDPEIGAARFADNNQWYALARELKMSWPGSNTHALLARRSTDNVTRLNINSHQPWSGPVAWYEAHIKSEEGWNMSGGTFPGAPLILHGHNDHLGWAHTVNYPDGIDVYKLTMHPEKKQYRYDDKWLDLEIKEVPLTIDLGLFNLTLNKDAYHSVHGPVKKYPLPSTWAFLT